MIGRVRRIWWQVTGVLLFNFPFLDRLTFGWLPVPVLNCYSCPLAQGACPIGTLQHFLVIGVVPLFIIGVILAWSAVAGRFYCGHLCPFGFLQDLLARIKKRHVRLPRAVGYLKYVSLVVLVLILPPIVKEPFFCTLCPAGSLEAGIPLVTQSWIDARFHTPAALTFGSGLISMVGWWFWFKMGLLALTIGAAITIKRPFCRMACPLGAALSLFNRISVFVHPQTPEIPGERPRFRLNDCPVDITHPGRVDSHDCIKCRQCYPKRTKKSL